MGFYTTISKYYELIFPLNMAQVDFVNNNVSHCGKIMDIGCSTGQLAVELSKQKFHVDAFDFDDKMIKLANKKVVENAKSPIFQRGDMKQITSMYPSTTYDGILCFGNTLVHLQSVDEIHKLLESVTVCLKSNGKFLFQILNYDHIIQEDINELPLIDNEHITFERYYEPLHEKLKFKTVLTVKNRNIKLENLIKLYPITKHELNSMLKSVGFKKVTYYSNFNMDEFDDKKLSLVVIAEK